MKHRSRGRSGNGAPWRSVGRALVALIGCAGVLVAITARADDDLPGRVARVANVQGTLRHAPGERAGDWSEIGLNDPVAQGDNLYVDRDGVAEVDYGGGQFRLAGETNLHVSRLDDRQLALFIAAGRVIVRVRVLEPDDSVHIDTPATQIALQRPGLYRIDVAADTPLTSVIVREGEAQVATPAGIETVWPGQTASSTGVATERIDIRNGGGLDGFDTWSAARDRVYEMPRQNAYVSRQMIGAADLDAHGLWQTFPGYGAVWFPTVDPAWAPYRFGHWTWLSGWGYTWVDLAPWGYAPFHYGRWAHIGGRWGWCPGDFVARPVWAPALVAWYGGGSWSRGPHGPVYGWVPLGWGEPFVPWWNRCNDRCFDRYNRPYAVNVAERRDAPPTRYANWQVPGGITAVPGSALRSGGPVAINRVPVHADPSLASTPLARPPLFTPDVPGRPAIRAAAPLPAPASTLEASRRTAGTRPSDRSTLVPVAPAGAVGHGTLAPMAPPVASRGGAGVAAPPSRAAGAVAPSGAPAIGSEPREPLRIDDGRFVLPPASRSVPPAGAAPTVEPAARATVPPRTAPTTVPPAMAQPVAPASVPHVPPPVAAPRSLPTPVPSVVPAPRSLPTPVPPAVAAPRSLPIPVPPAVSSAPQVAVPAPVAQPVAPAPSQRGTPGRAAPINPGPNDRPN